MEEVMTEKAIAVGCVLLAMVCAWGMTAGDTDVWKALKVIGVMCWMGVGVAVWRGRV